MINSPMIGKKRGKKDNRSIGHRYRCISVVEINYVFVGFTLNERLSHHLGMPKSWRAGYVVKKLYWKNCSCVSMRTWIKPVRERTIIALVLSELTLV